MTGEVRGLCVPDWRAGRSLSLPPRGTLVALLAFLGLVSLWAHPQAESPSTAAPYAREQLERGRHLMEQGKFAEAAREFTELEKSLPNSPLIFNLLGFCDLKQGFQDRAIANFKKAVALKPDFKPPHNNLGGIYLLEGRPQDAVDEFLAVIRIDPNDRQAYGNLARGELALGRTDDAIKDLRRSGDPRASVTLYAWATESFKRQNYETALALLKSVAAEMEQSAAWHHFAGESYFKLGDPGPAVNELQKAMELEPQNEDYVLKLGEVFVANNNAAAAATLFETASKVFPSSPKVWFGLGVAYLAEVHYSSAESALKKSLELDPKLDIAYVVLGRGYHEAGQWDELRETSRRLVELNPNNPAGYYYEALALLRSPPSAPGSNEEAEKLLRKSVALDESGTEDAEPRYELAKLLGKEGKKEAARQNLEKIIRNHPDFGPAHYQLSRLYREKGELDKSEEEQKEFERLSSEEREKAMTRMLVNVHERGTK